MIWFIKNTKNINCFLNKIWQHINCNHQVINNLFEAENLQIIFQGITSMIQKSQFTNQQFVHFLKSAFSICNSLTNSGQLDSSIVRNANFYKLISELRANIQNALSVFKTCIVQEKSEAMQLEKLIYSSFKQINKSLNKLDPQNFQLLPVYQGDNFSQSQITSENKIEFEKKKYTSQNIRRITVTVLQKNYQKVQNLNKKALQIKNSDQSLSSQVQNCRICYYVFVTKLKKLFEYRDSIHQQRMHRWMWFYIKMTNPNFKRTQEFIKSMDGDMARRFKSIDELCFYVERNLAIHFPIFSYYMGNFEQVFPQTQAVLNFFSVNNLEKNHKQDCQIAKQFLAKLSTRKLQTLKQAIRYEWTRYQHLTYVAFVAIQEDKIMSMKKDQFDNFANYSFEGDVQKVWHGHISLKSIEDWEQLYSTLVERWKFLSLDIEYEKIKLLQFFQKKQIEETLHVVKYLAKPSAFKQFLAEKQMIYLKSPLCILTDKFQLVSKTFKCFMLGQPFKQVKFKDKTQKERNYSVYLIAQFQINSAQKYYLKRLRQQLPKLQSQFKQINESEQRSQSKCSESNYESSATQWSQTKNPNNKDYEQDIQQCLDSDKYQFVSQKINLSTGIMKKIQKLNKNDQEIQKQDIENSYSKDVSIEKLDFSRSKHDVKSHLFFQDLKPATVTKTLHKKQKAQYEAFKNYKLIKDQQCINSSLQSTEVSFTWSQQTQSRNEKTKSNQIDYSRQGFIQQLKDIEEELNSEASEQESEDQIFNSISQIKDLKFLYSNQQAVNTDQLDKFIKSLVSEEESSRLQSLFRRKTLQFRLMSQFSNHDKKSEDLVETKVKKTSWKFSEDIKFVSFLIVNKFALQKHDQILDYTFRVMSEFIESKTATQCQDYYKNNKANSVHETIVFLIKKHKMPAGSIENQVKRLKQSYYLLKGNILEIKKKCMLNKKSKQKIQIKCQELIIKKLEQKPLIFNLKTDYLTDKKQQGNWYKEMVEKIRLVEKERYLKCLEIQLQQQKNIQKKRFMKFASEIFKERNVEEQAPLLQKYHCIMLRKHQTPQKILKNEKDENRKKEVRKSKAEMQRECNQQFLLHFCERIQTFGDILECQMLQNLIQVKDKQ